MIDEESKNEAQTANMKESAEAKKAALAKKKALMMQKMKQKQQDLIEKKVEHAHEEKMDVDKTSEADAAKDHAKISCAACQEVCDMNDYWRKPFVQMGYSTPSKLLYHSYRQTYESQKQNLQNQRAASQGKAVSTFETEEETKDAPKTAA